MKITIETIPHDKQRYDTCGDWRWVAPFHLCITVSEIGDWKMETCVGVHEVCEALICSALEISQNAVDEFDMAFTGDGEPGNAPGCPYRLPHRIATTIEFALAMAIGLNWNEYEKRLNAL